MEEEIEDYRLALKRILLSLVAMAGLDGATMPRRLRNAVLRLLRPAEAAARRLVIAMARGVVAPPPAPARARKPRPRLIRDGFGTGILLPPGMRPAAQPVFPRSLKLFDPQRRRARRGSASGVPSICVAGHSRRIAIRPPESPRDEVDAARLACRLKALGDALDDLPRQALRFARWRARAARARRGFGRPPLRFGPPPGFRPRAQEAVHGVLAAAHDLAVWALRNPDTS